MAVGQRRHQPLLLGGHGDHDVGGGQQLTVALEIGGGDRVLGQHDAELLEDQPRVERGVHAVARVGRHAGRAHHHLPAQPALREHALEERVGHHAAAGVGVADQQDASHGSP